MNKRGGKRAQVTIFIIIGILVVAAGLLIYFLTSKGETTIQPNTENPAAYIQACVEDDMQNAIETISLHGGSIEPEIYFTYNNITIEYLCYTVENNKLCVIQQPLLKRHIENEIEDAISNTARECFDSLVSSYESNGYTVEKTDGASSVEMLPEEITATFNTRITATKGETRNYNSFNVVVSSSLYELVGIAESMVEWEATTGKADPRIYMTYYSDLDVDGPPERDDGTRIYVLTNTKNGDSFQFAVRSGVIPPGY